MSTDDHLSISLPAALSEFVAGRISTGGFADASQYVSSLIEADRLKQARDELQRLLQEGIDSGPGRTISTKEWEEKIRSLQSRHAESK